MIRKVTSTLRLYGALTAFLAIAFSSLTAQEVYRPVICGNEILSNMFDQHHPALQARIDQLFDEAKHKPSARTSEPLHVKVVVHVVWNEAAENLHDSIIYNQIDILNNDFNRLNADTSELRPVYHPVAGNTNIHFELVAIERVQTDVLFEVDILGETLLPEVKYTDLGGSDGWDPEQYINIWVCKIQPIIIFGIEAGQVLGFSFPPADLPNWPPDVSAPAPGEDGLVIDYRVFGGNNPNPINNPIDQSLLHVKGRTPVHEMGHYLGLRHIWGDGGTFGPNDCAQSDGIDDTPYANSQSNFDCDKSKNTCEGVDEHYGLDMPDLIENYMDYAAEDCMNMFTLGQAALMRNVLLGPRVGLLGDPSSTNDLVDSEAIIVSPNPARDVIHIQSTIADFAITSVALMSVDGKIVFENTAVDVHAEIALPQIVSGMYWVRVSDGKKVAFKKVVIE
jgi:hypothetical protein